MKKIKYILILFLFSVFVLPVITFAISKVSLETNKKNFDINDPIQLQATIVADNGGSITVEGINNLSWFQIIGRNQSQSYQNINGQSSAKTQLIYTLKATKKGEYELWPLVLTQWTWKIISNTVKIKVTWEQIFIGNTNTLQNNTNSSPTNTINSLTTNTPQPEHFEAIKDIKENMKVPLLHYGLTLLVIILAWVLTYLYLYKNKKREEQEDVNDQKDISLPKKEINYKKMIKQVEEKWIESKKEVFYAKLGNIFRSYISQKIDSDFETKTLQEAKNVVDEEYYEMLQKLYYPEYNTQKDTQEERKWLIKELLQLCK